MESNQDNKATLDLLKPNQSDSKNTQIKVYKRRWVVLSIFIMYGAINSFQWIEYSIITNIVTRYYNVSTVTVDWTSIIYMALYAPLVFPASYLLDKKVGAITAIKVFYLKFYF